MNLSSVQVTVLQVLSRHRPIRLLPAMTSVAAATSTTMASGFPVWL